MKVKSHCCGNCIFIERKGYGFECRIDGKWKAALYIPKACSHYAEQPRGIPKNWEKVFKLNKYD